MHELVPADETLFHCDLAPGAEAVRQGLNRSFRQAAHGGILFEHANLVNRGDATGRKSCEHLM